MLEAICGASIFDGEDFFDKHVLLHARGEIVAVVPDEQCPAEAALVALSGGLIAPGFIDLQVNGGGGVLFSNSPTLESLALMAQAHRQFGTTQILPTLISGTSESCQRGVAAVKQALDSHLPGILGVHLEGPVFNPARRGVHKAEFLKTLDATQLQQLQAHAQSLGRGLILVTLAPELCTPGQIQTLVNSGILVCAGHTDASHGQILSAINEGLRGFTHLFNAMRGMQSRDPGVVGAALADSETWCGIIADGHHVHPLTLKVAINAKARGKTFLVSDAMATVGSKEKSFRLYGEDIHEQAGKLVNAEQRLAGSAIAQIHAVEFCVKHLHLPLAEALRMASLYPAQFIGVANRYGKLAKSYCADIVHFEQDFRILNTWQAGERQNHHPQACGQG